MKSSGTPSHTNIWYTLFRYQYRTCIQRFYILKYFLVLKGEKHFFKYNKVTFITKMLTPVSCFTVYYCKFKRKILRTEKDFTILPAKTVICQCVALNGLKTTVVTKGPKCVVRMASVQQTEIPSYNSSNQLYPMGCSIEETLDAPKVDRKTLY